MALDVTTLETLISSRYLSFTIPNPNPNPTPHLLRVAILDSPIQPSTDPPTIAAMYVPRNRESDWIFSTESGHLQLLLSSPAVSRLILIGRKPPDSPVTRYIGDEDTQHMKDLESTLKLLLPALSPKIYGNYVISDVPISVYEDDVIGGVVLERCVGVFVGEMLVEDVEVEVDGEFHGGNGGKREFRRRLRFKRMPMLVQSEVPIFPGMGFGLDCVKIGDVGFKPDIGVLVHRYLVPMVAALSLISRCIESRIQRGFRPKALCLGVGGGALLSFLKTQLGFEVSGVEKDEEVLRVARHYFGLKDGDIQVYIGDALEFIVELGSQGHATTLVSNKVEECCFLDGENELGSRFDVVMVDLDSTDARSGVSAPPLEFIERHILLAARSVLCHFGILVVNVIPPSRSFYDTFINQLRELFLELYEIDAGNEENFILIAKISPTLTLVSDEENTFLQKLRTVISGKFLDSIKKI